MSSPPHTSLSSRGEFANGVTAVAVWQFIVDHDESARIEDVANWFGLTVEDVAAALVYCSRHFDSRRAERWPIR